MLVAKTIRSLALAVATISSLSIATPTNRQDVIGSARAAYYSLPRKGFAGFQAVIEPNWEVTLGYAANADNLQVFRAVHFSIAIDASGGATLTQEVDEKQRARIEPYLKQIHDDVQRLVGSFFRTWGFFMIRSPFPEGQVRIESSNNKHQLFYSMQSGETVVTLNAELLITEWRFTDASARRTITPVFQKTSEGLLLTGYHTLFEPIGQGRKTSLNISVEYQDVGRMKLPSKLHLKGMYGIEPVEAEFRFVQYALSSKSL